MPFPRSTPVACATHVPHPVITRGNEKHTLSIAPGCARDRPFHIGPDPPNGDRPRDVAHAPEPELMIITWGRHRCVWPCVVPER
jgi:hypothetical protein